MCGFLIVSKIILWFFQLLNSIKILSTELISKTLINNLKCNYFKNDFTLDIKYVGIFNKINNFNIFIYIIIISNV